MNRSILLPVILVGAILFSQELIWPTNAGHAYSSNFGEYRDDHFHMGLDIKTNGRTGYEVYAIENGFISRIVSNFDGYGKALYLKTISGHIAVYAHLDKFSPILEKVWKLQQSRSKSYMVNANYSSREFQVKKGDVIGYTGNTGSSFAPHLHFELRNSQNEPLDPLSNGLLRTDGVTPILNKLAFIPLSREALINSSPLTQIIPLFRDKSGIYLFADTLSTLGDFGLAIQAVDKREGAKNVYQFHRAELFINGKSVFKLVYDRIPYTQSSSAKTLIQFGIKRENLGEFQKLYRLPEHSRVAIHDTDDSGVLRLDPGYHQIEIKIRDAAGNEALAKGVLVGAFPISLTVDEIQRDEKVVTLAISPKRGGLPVRDATIYSFTPFGYPDLKLKNLHTQRVGKSLHVSIPLKDTENRIMQILCVNQIGAMASPVHWENYKTPASVIDLYPGLDISHTERGVFFQIKMDQYSSASAILKLSNDNTFQTYPLTQIQPTVFLSEMLPVQYLRDIKFVDVSLSHGGYSRETRFNFQPGIAEPGIKTVILSRDRNCSIQTVSRTVYAPTAVWIDKVNKHAPVDIGYHLSPVYQLQPFNHALQDSFLIGLRYEHQYSGHSKMGIYYYDRKEQQWIYTPTKNNPKRQILTTSLDQFDAVTIIQDLEHPKILKTIPAHGGHYKTEDITKIKIDVDDDLSGIEAKEASFSLTLDGQSVYFAYQPVIKQLSYTMDRTLQSGNHKFGVTVRDQVGNEIHKTILFSID
jgi:hypothetical protein